MPSVVIAKLPAQARTASTRARSAPGGEVFRRRRDQAGEDQARVAIILENKSYDASFTVSTTTLTCGNAPSQGVMLKNYLRHGHDSLDNYLSLASGQAPLTDTQSDCPDYDSIAGRSDYSGNLKQQLQLRAARVRGGSQPPPSVRTGACIPARCRRFQPVRQGGREWKGYAQDLGIPTPVACTTRGLSIAGLPTLRRGDGGHGAGRTPARPTAPIQYVPKALPVPVVLSRCCSPATATRRISRTVLVDRRSFTTTCRGRARRRRSAGSALTTAPMRTTPSATQQPVGRLLRTRTRPMRGQTTPVPVRLRSVPRACDFRDRGVPPIRRWHDRRHV